MQSQNFEKNVNWNVAETFLITYKLFGCIWLNHDWIKTPWLNKIVTAKKILILHSIEVSCSPNSPPLFVKVFWGEPNRSSLSQKFYKVGVLKYFANFIGKHQCKSIFLIKLQAWTPATLLKRESNTGVFLWNLRKF